MTKERIIIRTVKIEDASMVLQIQEGILEEGIFLTTSSVEFENTVDNQIKWIKKLLNNDKETMLVAESESGIVGWIVFTSPNRIRLSHTGSLGLMIKKDFRNMGIGQLLIEGLLEWAQLNLLIEKVRLGVFSTNQRAITLYKKMGFIEEGRKIKEIKMDDETYVDDILMYKFV